MELIFSIPGKRLSYKSQLFLPVNVEDGTYEHYKITCCRSMKYKNDDQVNMACFKILYEEKLVTKLLLTGTEQVPEKTQQEKKNFFLKWWRRQCKK